MPADKNIKLGLVADTTAAQAGFSRLLKSLTQGGKDLSRVFGQIKIGDLNIAGLSKLAKEWERLNNTLGRSGTSFKGLVANLGSTGREVDIQTKKLEGLRLAWESTKKTYARAETRFQHFGMEAIGERTAAGKAMTGAGAAVTAQEDLVKGLGQAGGSSLLLKLVGVGAISAIATATWKAIDAGLTIPGMRNQWTTQTQARYGSIEGSIALRPGQGDYSEMLARTALLKDPARAQDLADVSDSGRMNYRFRQSLSALNPFSDVPLYDAIPGLSSTKGDMYRRAQAAEATKQLTDASGAANPALILAGQMYSGSSGSYLNFRRSMGMTEGHSRGFLKDIASATGGGFINGNWSGGKFGIPEQMGMASGIAMSGGGRAGAEGLTAGALKVVLTGMDQSAVAQMSGAFAAGGGGKALLSHLENVAGTSMDVFAAQRAGGFVGQNYLSGTGLSSGSGLMKYMTGGYAGDATDSYHEKYRESSLASLGGLLTGGDPYNRGMGMASALSITRGNPNQDLMSADVLASVITPQDYLAALGGEVSGVLKAFGLSAQDVRKQGDAKFAGLAVRIKGMASGNSPVSRLIRKNRGNPNAILGGWQEPSDAEVGQFFFEQKDLPDAAKTPEEARQEILGIRSARGHVSLPLPSMDMPSTGLTPKKDVGEGGVDFAIIKGQIDQGFTLYLSAQTNLRDAMQNFANSIAMINKQALGAPGVIGDGITARQTAGPLGWLPWPTPLSF